MNDIEPGTRIRLLSMPDDPSPLPHGATGTVEEIGPELPSGIFGRPDDGPWRQVTVAWDPPHQSRTLLMSVPPDKYEVIKEDDHE